LSGVFNLQLVDPQIIITSKILINQKYSHTSYVIMYNTNHGPGCANKIYVSVYQGMKYHLISKPILLIRRDKMADKQLISNFDKS